MAECGFLYLSSYKREGWTVLIFIKTFLKTSTQSIKTLMKIKTLTTLHLCVEINIKSYLMHTRGDQWLSSADASAYLFRFRCSVTRKCAFSTSRIGFRISCGQSLKRLRLKFAIFLFLYIWLNLTSYEIICSCVIFLK